MGVVYGPLEMYLENAIRFHQRTTVKDIPFQKWVPPAIVAQIEKFGYCSIRSIGLATGAEPFRAIRATWWEVNSDVSHDRVPNVSQAMEQISQ